MYAKAYAKVNLLKNKKIKINGSKMISVFENILVPTPSSNSQKLKFPDLIELMK
jgi:hypothetical protein